MKINFTDPDDLLELENKFKCEKDRIFAWTKVFKESESDNAKIYYSENMHRCRRLNKIIGELIALRETYEQK